MASQKQSSKDPSKHFPQACLYPNRDADPFKHLPGYRMGVIGPEKLPLGFYEDNQGWHATVQINRRDYSLYSFHDQNKLLDFLKKQCGEIVW